MPDDNETPAATTTYNITFGTASYKNAVTNLIITSIKKSETAQAAEAMDEDGTIVQIDYYGKKKTLQIEGTVNGGSLSGLTAGGTLTIDSTDYKIESVEITQTNNGHQNASISASAPGGAVADSSVSSGSSD